MRTSPHNRSFGPNTRAAQSGSLSHPFFFVAGGSYPAFPQIGKGRLTKKLKKNFWLLWAELAPLCSKPMTGTTINPPLRVTTLIDTTAVKSFPFAETINGAGLG